MLEDFGDRQKFQWCNKRVVINFKKVKVVFDQFENVEVVVSEKKKEEDEDGKVGEEEEEEEEVIIEEVCCFLVFNIVFYVFVGDN